MNRLHHSTLLKDSVELWYRQLLVYKDQLHHLHDHRNRGGGKHTRGDNSNHHLREAGSYRLGHGCEDP